MKNILLKIRRFLPRPNVLRSLFFVFGFGYIGFAYASLFPGPLSGSMAEGEAIGGYVSHAQFERGCTHCHVPLHCIGEERCQECHIEIAEQKSEANGLHGLLPGTNRCQNCHVEHQGREADITTLAFKRIDHAALADFSLDYHQQDYDDQPMDCQSCHSQDEYRAASLDCITCHATEDHDLMASHIDEHGSQCRSCHDGKTRLADFEHNVQAFNLTGAHTELACKECHVDPDLQYKEIPTACANCHGDEQPEEHGFFGSDCQRCHETTAFAPARLTQHTFNLEHGMVGTEVDCRTCHTLSYTAVNCLDCHVDDRLLDAEHAGLGLEQIGNCVTCHPSGTLGNTDNFPLKAGRPEQETTAVESSQPVQQGMQVVAEPTFSSKDAGQAPNKEQEGTSSRP